MDSFTVVGIVDVVGAVLLHFVWQGVLIGLGYAAARPLFAGVSARYRLGMSALIAMAVCPLATLVYVWPSATGDQTATLLPGLGATVMAVADRAVYGWQLHQAVPWFVGLWSLGVLLLTTRSLWQWRRLARMVRDAAAPPQEWANRLANLRERFGLRRPVRLLCSARAVTPMLIGWIRPVVLLPASMMSGFTSTQIELIIAHELGHICRLDYVANLFQVVLETVLFYHPVVHWISHDVRNARESCCDDLVLNVADGNRLAYARTLADLEELRHDETLLVPALGASGGVLLDRIRHIVGVSEVQDRMPRIHSWPIVLIVAMVALFAWRQQTHSTLPDAKTIAQSLADAPAQALAIVAGNVATHPIVTPVSIAPPVSEPVQESMPAEAIKIDHPRVTLAMTERLNRVSNIIAPAPMASPTLQLAEAEATAVVPAAPMASHAAPQRTALHIVPPVYPAHAMSSGIEGSVELEFDVNADGIVSDIRTIKAKPTGVFDGAARAALSAWRFAPGSTADHRSQTFAFTLHNRHVDEKCQLTTGTMICRRPGE
jgi:bla regulator protein BlaR1